MGQKFKEFMTTKKEVNRYLISSIFVIGMLCGSVITVLFMWSALA